MRGALARCGVWSVLCAFDPARKVLRDDGAMTQASKHSSGDGFELMLEMDMEIGVFSSNWSYCDRISSYAARMISHNRADSLLYSNLFSSAFNELLETVYRAHGPKGNLLLRVYRRGNRDRIELSVPCDPENSGFYREARTCLAHSDLADQYRSALHSPGPLRPEIGLMELAVDYGATLHVEITGANTVRLVAEMTLEGSGDHGRGG